MADKRARSGTAGLGRVAGLGAQFVVAILLFLALGQWLDGKLGTEPLFLYIGVFTGAAGAFYSMYRGLMAEQRRAEAELKQAQEDRANGAPETSADPKSHDREEHRREP